MKNIYIITFIVILLLSLPIFSQTDSKYQAFPEGQFKGSINSIIKPEEHQKQGLQTKVSNDSEIRTIINKKALENGYLLVEMIEQRWRDSNWVNYQRYIYTYDSKNNLIEEIYQEWDVSNWLNKWKGTYTYDSNNNLIEELGQDWDGSNWVDSSRNTYTYDSNNNLIEELGQNWDGSNWVNYGKETYTYDSNNNLIEEIEQEWDGSNWVNSWKYTHTYDSNNNLIEKITQYWIGSNWVNLFKYINTYDSNNNLIESLNQIWDGSNWVNTHRSLYSHSPTDVEEIPGEIKTYSLSNNYPNPFNPSTTIKYQIPKSGLVTLKVYNVLGKEITTLVNEEKSVGSYEITFDASGLSSGIYFYKLSADNFQQTKKMILLK